MNHRGHTRCVRIHRLWILRLSGVQDWDRKMTRGMNPELLYLASRCKEGLAVENRLMSLKKRMSDFQEKLERKLKMESAEVPDSAVWDITAHVIITQERRWWIPWQITGNLVSMAWRTYLDRELGIRRGDEGPHRARMKQRDVYKDGRLIGSPSNNPLLDNCKYEVDSEYHSRELASSSRWSRTTNPDD